MYYLYFITCKISEGTFQLVDSSGNYISSTGQEGLLLHNGGSVCDDLFNITAAHAICKEMGFAGALKWTNGVKWQIQSTLKIKMDDVRCPLPDWSSCSYSTKHNCNSNHAEDIFLTCSISMLFCPVLQNLSWNQSLQTTWSCNLCMITQVLHQWICVNLNLLIQNQIFEQNCVFWLYPRNYANFALQEVWTM